MKIALTGGTGFIGSHFLKHALAKGNTVVGIRRSPQSRTRISVEQPVWINHQLDEVIASDLKGCNVLVHLAAHSVKYPFDTIEKCLQWNLIAVLKLFEQARLAGIKHYIIAGSCFEYGYSGDRYLEIPTNAPLEPTNSYATSKAAASIALKQWAEHHELNLEIIRVFHVYGEGEMKERFWPSLRTAAIKGENFKMTGGEQIRDFMNVDAVARCFVERAGCITDNSQHIEQYNLSTGNSISLRKFAEHWWSFWGAKGNLIYGAYPYRKNEVFRYIPGSNKLIIK